MSHPILEEFRSLFYNGSLSKWLIEHFLEFKDRLMKKSSALFTIELF